MKLKILYFIYRLIQLFTIIFITDRLEMNFWAKFGILLLLLLIFDETEEYVQRFFNIDSDLSENELSDNQGE
ncbi:MAG: hypothetical protein IKK66_04575 [Ruminococcus sp.]|nr:hypothetical protein [Ruminococcus sp.]